MVRRPIAAAAAALLVAALPPAAGAPQCRGTVYLTFDTGSQSQAEFIAATLKRHGAKATFFLANEKTVRGDWSLDPSWAPANLEPLLAGLERKGFCFATLRDHPAHAPAMRQ
jgi:hypothetical protein